MKSQLYAIRQYNNNIEEVQCGWYGLIQTIRLYLVGLRRNNIIDQCVCKQHKVDVLKTNILLKYLASINPLSCDIYII